MAVTGKGSNVKAKNNGKPSFKDQKGKLSKGINKNNSLKSQKAKGKVSKVLVNKLNTGLSMDEVNDVTLLANSRPSAKESESQNVFKGIKEDHAQDMKTQKSTEEKKAKTEADIQSQLELISGFSF